MNDTNVTEPNPGSKLKWWKKILLLIFLIALVGLVLLVVLEMALPLTLKLQLMSRFNGIRNAGTSQGAWKAKTPKPNRQASVSQTISSKDGGKIQVKDALGALITLYVFPSSVSQDTKITLSPLLELPIRDYGKTSSYGVLIEPVDLKFAKPALLVFDFTPDSEDKNLFQTDIPSGVGSMPSGTGTIPQGGSNSQIQFPEVNDALKQLKDAGLVQGTSTTAGSAASGSATQQGGGAWVMNESSGGSENVDSKPTGSQSADGSVSAPINGGGSYTADEADKDQTDKLNEQAPISGGKCDLDSMRDILGMVELNQSVPGGDPGPYESAAQKCSEKIIDELKARCDADESQLRRRDFMELAQIFQKFISPNSELYEKFMNVMYGCVARFEIKGSGSGTKGTTTITYDINARICGFVDDKEWRGNYNLKTITPIPGYGNEVMDNKGAVSFILPPRGGPVTGLISANKAVVTFGSFKWNFNIEDSAGGFGIFDGNKTINMEMPLVSMPPMTIRKVGECKDPQRGMY